MKTKEIVKELISLAIIYIIIAIGLRSLVTGEFDWGIAISSLVGTIVFFALFFAFGFIKIMRKYQDILVNTVPAVELTMDERLLLESPANHIKGWEAVGGKLFLTDKRLVFKSHKFNVQNHQQEFPLNQVNTVVQGGGKLGRVLWVTFANNKTERFIVDSPLQWIQMLQQQSNMI